MPVFQMARTGHDIINGLITVSQGTAPPAYYDPTQRDQHIPSGSAVTMNLFTELDTRYKMHGGPGGSGAWEH